MDTLCQIFPLCSKWLTKELDAGVMNDKGTNRHDNLVLFLGDPSLWKSSLLFQAAVSYASEGRRVVYVCPQQLESMPPGVHGMPQPTADLMSQVKLLYISSMKELMNYLSSIQLVADAPDTLILCNLYYYAKQDMKEDIQQSLRKLCSLLSDVTICLEEKSNGSFKVLVSSSEESTSNRPIYSRYFPEIFSVSGNKKSVCECKQFTDTRAQKITYFYHKDQLFLDKIFENKR